MYYAKKHGQIKGMIPLGPLVSMTVAEDTEMNAKQKKGSCYFYFRVTVVLEAEAEAIEAAIQARKSRSWSRSRSKSQSKNQSERQSDSQSERQSDSQSGAQEDGPITSGATRELEDSILLRADSEQEVFDWITALEAAAVYSGGDTALLRSIRAHDHEETRTLLLAGADPQQRFCEKATGSGGGGDRGSGSTFTELQLHLAARLSNVPAAKMLLADGAPPDSTAGVVKFLCCLCLRCDE